MRLEMTSTPRGVLLINDAYTADPLSVSSALAVLASEKREGKSIAVLGGLAGLGAQAERARLGARQALALFQVGPGAERLVAGPREHHHPHFGVGLSRRRHRRAGQPPAPAACAASSSSWRRWSTATQAPISSASWPCSTGSREKLRPSRWSVVRLSLTL